MRLINNLITEEMNTTNKTKSEKLINKDRFELNKDIIEKSVKKHKHH